MDIFGILCDAFWEELALCDFESKLLFEFESDIKDIDGLGAKVSDQRCFRNNLIIIDVILLLLI